MERGRARQLPLPAEQAACATPVEGSPPWYMRPSMRSPGRPVLALLALLAGCATLRDISAASFVRPSIACEAITADGLDEDGVTVVIHLRVDNPNPTALRLARLGYELEVEGR